MQSAKARYFALNKYNNKRGKERNNNLLRELLPAPIVVQTRWPESTNSLPVAELATVAVTIAKWKSIMMTAAGRPDDDAFRAKRDAVLVVVVGNFMITNRRASTLSC